MKKSHQKKIQFLQIFYCQLFQKNSAMQFYVIDDLALSKLSSILSVGDLVKLLPVNQQQCLDTLKDDELSKKLGALRTQKSQQITTCIDHMYARQLQTDIDYEHETLSLTIACLQQIYQDLTDKEVPQWIGPWILLQISCLYKKLGERVLGSIRFIQWYASVNQLLINGTKRCIDKVKGYKRQIQNLLITIFQYKIDYETYIQVLQEIQKFNLATNIKMNEQQRINELHYRLLVISSLIAPKQTFLVLNDLINFNKSSVQSIFKLKISKQYDYSLINLPTNAHKKLTKKIPQQYIKYLQVSKKKEGQPKRAQKIYWLKQQKAYYIRQLPKQRKRKKIDYQTLCLQQIQQLIHDPDQFLIKKQLQEVCSQIFNPNLYQIDMNSTQNYCVTKQNYPNIPKYKTFKKNQMELYDIQDMSLQQRQIVNSRQRTMPQQRQQVIPQYNDEYRDQHINLSLYYTNAQRYTQLYKLKSWMLKPQNQIQAKKDFLEYCKIMIQKLYPDESQKIIEMNQLREFEKDLQRVPEDIRVPIYWYTKQCFVHKCLNLGLRKLQDCRSILYIRYFFFHLFHSVFELYILQRETKIRKKSITCYRGCFMSDYQLQTLKECTMRENEMVQLEGFLSTSLNPQTAMNFMKKYPQGNRCLLVIDIPKTQKSSLLSHLNCFACIDKYSDYSNEAQILLNPINFFKVVDYRQIKNYDQKYVEIRLSYYNIGLTIKNYQKDKKQNLPSLVPQPWALKLHSFRKDQGRITRNQGAYIPQWVELMMINRYQKLDQKTKELMNKRIESIRGLKIQLPQILLEILRKFPANYFKNSKLEKDSGKIQVLLSLVEICEQDYQHLMVTLVRMYYQKTHQLQKVLSMIDAYIQFKQSETNIRRRCPRNLFICLGFLYLEKANILFHNDLSEQCQQALNQVIYNCEKAYPSIDNFQNLQCLKILGKLYKKEQRYTEALKFLDIQTSVFHYDYMHGNQFYGQFLNLIGEIHQILNNKRQAIKNYQKGLRFMDHYVGRNKQYKKCIMKLCQILAEQSLDMELTEYFATLISLIMTYGPNDFNISQTKFQWWFCIAKGFHTTKHRKIYKICMQIALRVSKIHKVEVPSQFVVLFSELQVRSSEMNMKVSRKLLDQLRNECYNVLKDQ